MTITTLAKAALDRAWYWQSLHCRETKKNGGSCIDDVTAAFYGKPRQESYCTIFAWVVIDQACKSIGIANALPKTAGARDLRNRAAKVVQVDKTPAIGSVFYHLPTAAGSTGHCGVVVYIDGAGIGTVEGNHSDRIDSFSYTSAQIRDPRTDWVFIHTESIGNTPLIEAGGVGGGSGGSSLLAVGAIAAMAAGGYYLLNQS